MKNDTPTTRYETYQAHELKPFARMFSGGINPHINAVSDVRKAVPEITQIPIFPPGIRQEEFRSACL